MTIDQAKRDPNRAPTHPGEMLRLDVLPALNVSAATAARELGVSLQTLQGILAGAIAVSPEMALRLGKVCRNGPDLWLNMQRAYDLWHVEREQ